MENLYLFAFCRFSLFIFVFLFLFLQMNPSSDVVSKLLLHAVVVFSVLSLVSVLFSFFPL